MRSKSNPPSTGSDDGSSQMMNLCIGPWELNPIPDSANLRFELVDIDVESESDYSED